MRTVILTLEVVETGEPEMFSLEIGAWVDIAFLTMCASAIDLLHVRARLSPVDHLTNIFSCCDSQGDARD